LGRSGLRIDLTAHPYRRKSFLEGGTLMASKISCIFNRNSKCIFKGGLCDLDCDKANWEGEIRSNENLLEECLERGDWKSAFARKAVNLFLL
jgi:hypothetical protein